MLRLKELDPIDLLSASPDRVKAMSWQSCSESTQKRSPTSSARSRSRGNPTYPAREGGFRTCLQLNSKQQCRTRRPTESARLTIARAINEALLEAMTDDPAVMVMGEDVAKIGGIWGTLPGTAGAVRPRARARHAHLGIRIHRRRGGHGRDRTASCRRADVRRLLRRVHGCDLQPGREASVLLRRAGHSARWC